VTERGSPSSSHFRDRSPPLVGDHGPVFSTIGRGSRKVEQSRTASRSNRLIQRQIKQERSDRQTATNERNMELLWFTAVRTIIDAVGCYDRCRACNPPGRPYQNRIRRTDPMRILAGAAAWALRDPSLPSRGQWRALVPSSCVHRLSTEPTKPGRSKYRIASRGKFLFCATPMGAAHLCRKAGMTAYRALALLTRRISFSDEFAPTARRRTPVGNCRPAGSAQRPLHATLGALSIGEALLGHAIHL